jgi:hypothetical protein
MKNSILTLASLATIYSGYKIYKYKTTETDMSANERLFVGVLGTLSIGTLMYYSVFDKK